MCRNLPRLMCPGFINLEPRLQLSRKECTQKGLLFFTMNADRGLLGNEASASAKLLAEFNCAADEYNCSTSGAGRFVTFAPREFPVWGR